MVCSGVNSLRWGEASARVERRLSLTASYLMLQSKESTCAFSYLKGLQLVVYDCDEFKEESMFKKAIK